MVHGGRTPHAAAVQRSGEDPAVHLCRYPGQPHGGDLRPALPGVAIHPDRAGGGEPVRYSGGCRNAGAAQLHIVTRQGQGILFSGPSGIGKSTQAALWQRYAGAEIINGDRALVRPDTGTVSGVFYAGTSGISRNVTAPLQAVVLLEQGSENRITALRPQEAFARLLSQCAYYQRDAASAARMTELAAQLVTNVPVRQLTCRADGDAVRALEEELRRS